ncbi:MAG: VCBS repeat-containing protein [Aquihabitans sp.]
MTRRFGRARPEGLWGAVALLALLVLTPVADRVLRPDPSSTSVQSADSPSVSADPSVGRPRGTAPGTRLDFDGDGIADQAVVRHESGQLVWYLRPSSGASISFTFGLTGDLPVPADYDGDGTTEPAVWRADGPGAPQFFIREDEEVRSVAFGQRGDDPTVTADYDGDGVDDIAVYRDGYGFLPSVFYHLSSGDGSVHSVPFGLEGDVPVRGDFDGDGIDDQTVARPEGDALIHYTLRSSDGAVDRTVWGLPTDQVVPGDYDGDGRSDHMIVRADGRQLVWWRYDGGSGTSVPWGQIGDRPVVADYDGDGIDDIAVWRPDTGQYLVLPSAGGARTDGPWGLPSDEPIGSVRPHG